MNRFEGKVVIVTGAAGGIGRAAVLRFAAEGAAVVAVDLDDGGLARIVAAVEAAGGTAHAVRADVTRSDDVKAYVQAAMDRFGGVDVLFNNAGTEGVVAPLEDYPEETFDRVMAVNVKGVWLGMRHVAGVMRARGGGAIVNASSGAGLRGTPELIAYGASKHAVIGMTATAAIELAPAGIRCERRLPRARGHPDAGGHRGRQVPRRSGSVPEAKRRAEPHGPAGQTRGSRRPRDLPGIGRRLVHQRRLARRRRRLGRRLKRLRNDSVPGIRGTTAPCRAAHRKTSPPRSQSDQTSGSLMALKRALPGSLATMWRGIT